MANSDHVKAFREGKEAINDLARRAGMIDLEGEDLSSTEGVLEGLIEGTPDVGPLGTGISDPIATASGC